MLVVWWTGFPIAFAAAMNTLILPMLLALLGIVLRGAAFAFLQFAPTLAQARLYGVVFALSSVITPFFLGAVAGAIASGRVPLNGRGDLWASWLNPTSLVGGLVAVGTCSFLAGVFLTADAAGARDQELTDALRIRTLAVGLGSGVVVLAGLLPLEEDAPTLWSGLAGRALPLILLSAIGGVATLALLWVRRPGLARVPAVVAVAAVLSGWGLGQYPWLLVDEIRIADAAGAPATLQGLLVVTVLEPSSSSRHLPTSSPLPTPPIRQSRSPHTALRTSDKGEQLRSAEPAETGAMTPRLHRSVQLERRRIPFV